MGESHDSRHGVEALSPKLAPTSIEASTQHHDPTAAHIRSGRYLFSMSDLLTSIISRVWTHGGGGLELFPSQTLGRPLRLLCWRAGLPRHPQSHRPSSLEPEQPRYTTGTLGA